MSEALNNRMNIVNEFFKGFTNYLELEDFRAFLMLTLTSQSPMNIMAQLGLGGDKSIINLPYNPDFNIYFQKINLISSSSIVLYTQTDCGALLGVDEIGERGKSSEVVGRKAAEKLLKELKAQATVDINLADMLIPYMALARGESSFHTSVLTQHTITNIHIAEEFLDVKFVVKGEMGSVGQVKVKGVGLEGASFSSEPDLNA